jgi:hypothetical protein
MEVAFHNIGSAAQGEWSPDEVQVIKHRAWADPKSKGFASNIGCGGGLNRCGGVLSSLVHCWLSVGCSRRGEWWCERGRGTEASWEWV